MNIVQSEKNDVGQRERALRPSFFCGGGIPRDGRRIPGPLGSAEESYHAWLWRIREARGLVRVARFPELGRLLGGPNFPRRAASASGS